MFLGRNEPAQIQAPSAGKQQGKRKEEKQRAGMQKSLKQVFAVVQAVQNGRCKTHGEEP